MYYVLSLNYKTTQFIGMMMPKKQRDNIVALEKVKEKYPEMAEVVDARITVIQERLKNWADPAAIRDEALVRKHAETPMILGKSVLPTHKTPKPLKSPSVPVLGNLSDHCFPLPVTSKMGS